MKTTFSFSKQIELLINTLVIGHLLGRLLWVNLRSIT